jgi:hypothetical protein
MIVLLPAIRAIVALLVTPRAAAGHGNDTSRGGNVTMERYQSVAGAFALILGVSLVGYIAVGFAGVLFSAAFIGGLILWLTTTFRRPIDPEPIIVPYLATVICFIVHVSEECAAHVERYLSLRSGLQVTQADFLIIAAFAAPIVWLLGAVMILKRWTLGYFLVSTFLFGMMFAELSHFVSPFMEDDGFHYVPGLYTAILPVTAGWLTFRAVLHEMKNGSSVTPRGLRGS